MIEVLDLFSAAAGGWSLGMHRAGFTTMAACEVEAWRRALYSENNPNVKVYDDVRTLTANRLLSDLGRLPSIVVGSPPCQDISSANTKGRGVEGERSGLYFEAVRLIGECRPRWFALENSANLRTRGADAVCAALEAIGYTCWPCVVRAGDIDANHERPRAWLIGCDLEQVTNSDGDQLWQQSGWRGREGGRGPLLAAHDARYPDVEPGAAGLGAAPGEGANAHGAGRLRSYAEHGRSGSLPAAYATSIGCIAWSGSDQGEDRGLDGRLSGDHDAHGAGDAANADQARQAHGCVEPGIRPEEVADDGRGARRGDDRSIAGQVGVCTPDRGAALGHRADWSLADLADHLRLDDGLSTRLAGHRVDIGDGKGPSAASLIVEAFGDAVVPQIPEAIGRAILRTERALSEIYGRAAA